jgi:hypothetical protein
MLLVILYKIYSYYNMNKLNELLKLTTISLTKVNHDKQKRKQWANQTYG